MALCLISNARPNLLSLYFLKIDSNTIAQQSITFGLFHYCIEQVQCQQETFTVPFDAQIIKLLNATSSSITEEVPPHDSHMLVAFIFCLLCLGISFVLCLYKLTSKSYHDKYFTRGFLATWTSLWSLLLVTLTSITFQQAAEQLQEQFEISIGLCIPMVGCAFMIFFLAGCMLLLGCVTVVPSTKADMYH